MATYFVDLENGSDANNGTTFALRKKTLNSLTGLVAGDAVRVMASKDETLVGNATWTQSSKTVTLASAVTANIQNCDTAWTASTNITTGTKTDTWREGTAAATFTVGASFTTGLMAYKALGAVTDFSGYQQVSFFINNGGTALAANAYSLRLCSDTAGVTTVNTIAIPAIPHTSALPWVPITVNLGTALGSSIQSVALYRDSGTGTPTIALDNIIACKASSAPDALSLTSLIGKAHNVGWTASTAYSLNDIRIPTALNRNGLRYQVTTAGTTGTVEPAWPTDVGLTVADGSVVWTCEGLEDTWYAIGSINGTSVNLESYTGTISTSPSTGRSYAHATETVATYKRDPIALAMTATSATGTSSLSVQVSGTDAANIAISGGWNRTDMSTLTGQTWVSGQNGFNAFVYGQQQFIQWSYLNCVRFATGFYIDGMAVTMKHCHANHCNGNGILNGTLVAQNFVNVQANFCSTIGVDIYTSAITSGFAISGNSNSANGGVRLGQALQYLNYVTAKNNTLAGVLLFGPYATINNLTTALNSNGISTNSANGCTLTNPQIAEVNPITGLNAGADWYIWASKWNRTANAHRGITDGGVIQGATDQRHTASGISWKFSPTATGRKSNYPLKMAVAKVACSANTAVTVGLWTYRDNANIKGRLLLRGGQIAGVGADVFVDCQPSVSTWTQYSLTFTPTEAGVVELHFLVWDGVGTTNNFWIDDLTIS